MNLKFNHPQHMKKILHLLALFCLCVVGSATSSWASTKTFTFDANSSANGSDAPISYSTSKNSASNAPACYSNGLRIYYNATKGGSIKFTSNAGKITKITFTYASQSNAFPKTAPDGGSLSNSGTTGTWTSTTGESSVEFFNTQSTNNQVIINKAVVEYEDSSTGGGTVIPNPDPNEPSGEEIKFTKVTSLDQIGDSAECVIAYSSSNTNKAMGAQNGTYRNAEDVSISENTLTSNSKVVVFTITKDGNQYTIKDDNGYLCSPTSSSNNVITVTSLSNSCKATLTKQTDGTFKITFNSNGTNTNNVELQYNTSSPRFACYTGSQKNVNIYIKESNKQQPNVSFSLTQVEGEMYNHQVTEPTLISDSKGTVTYSSSNTSVATVDNATGKLTLIKDGTAVITAKVAETNDYTAGSASYTLTVTDNREDVNLSWPVTEFKAVLGDENTMFPIISNPNKVNLELRSSNQEVADIALVTKKITLKKGGETDISAKYVVTNEDMYLYKPADPVKYTLKVHEKYNPEFVDLNITYGNTGETINLGSSHPSNITFSCEPSDIVTISNDGKITINRVGTTKVTANWSEQDFWIEGTASFNLTVNKATYEYSFTKDINLFVGDEKFLFEGNNHPEFTVNITSGNDVISYDETSHKIKALEPGHAILKVTWGDDNFEKGEAIVNVTVSKAPTMYQIVFKTGGSNTNTQFKSDKNNPTLADQTTLLKGEEYVGEVTSGSNSFPDTAEGIRVGSASGAGYLKFNLSDKGKVKANKIVIHAKGSNNNSKLDLFADYSSNTNHGESISISDYSDYEFELDGTLLESINIYGYYRVYINSITVYYIDETPELEQVATPTIKANGVEIEEDAEIPVGTEITIDCETEGATLTLAITYTENEDDSIFEEGLTTPYKFTVGKEDIVTVEVVADADGKTTSEEASVTFEVITIGEVDPDMPTPGSTFKLVHHNNPELLTEGYYVIGRKEANLAMGRTGNNNIAAITDSYDIKEINTNPFNLTVASVNAKPFNVITTKDDNVLIVRLEKNEASQWGIKTVNYEDGFTTSQGYLKADASGTALTLSKDFVPLNIELTTSDNVDIYFEDKKDKKTIKYVTSGGGNFSYQSSGSAIQLYKYTNAKEFVADYGIFSIPQGEPRKAMPLNEEYPENIKYWIKGNTTVISMDEGSDIIQTNPDRTSDELIEHPFVYAAWDETDDWFGGITQFQVIVKYYLNAKQFGFEYDEIRGKKDVGVAAQAARYLGTGKVEYRVYDVYDIETQTFVETPETELSINHETGMIRPEDIVNAKLNKDYIVVATVDETDEHMPAYRSYIIRIEDFTPPTVSNKATFDFTSSGSYGLFAFDSLNQKNSKGEEVFEGNIEEQIDSKYQGHTSVSTIYADEDKNISLMFTGKYRDWTGTGNDYHLRVYSESTMSISVPEGYSISSIEFSSPNSTANGNNFTTSISSKDNIWSDGNSKWNAPNGGINTLTFTANATIRISQITVEIDAPNHSEKTLSTLSFPEDARLYNIFEGETETISGLTSSAVPFELIEYDIDNVEGINGSLEDDEYDQGPFTNYVINPKWNDEQNAVDIDVTVNTPGIYTFRAYNESDDQYYAGMAILRLNVFPRFEVLPKSDGDLADDVRTKHPQLTLVNHDEDEKATIKLPNLSSLNNDYKYSTVTLNVEVKHGDDNYKYSSLDEESIPESFVFKQDGYVKYEMLYANTDDFKKEETVHVVLMPSWNFTADSNSITIIPTANSTLQYCYFQTRYYDKDGRKPGEFVESTKKGVKARATTEEKVNDWVTTNEATTFSVDDSGFTHEDGYWIGVKYRTVKDVNDITELGLEDPILASDYNTILFTDSGIPTGIDDINTDFSDFESEGEAVYFNLQGQKVNKPERGVYIIVKDGKAEKVIF